MTARWHQSHQSAASEELTCCGDLYREVIKRGDALFTDWYCSSAHPQISGCNRDTESTKSFRPHQTNLQEWVRNAIDEAFHFVEFKWRLHRKSFSLCNFQTQISLKTTASMSPSSHRSRENSIQSCELKANSEHNRKKKKKKTQKWPKLSNIYEGFTLRAQDIGLMVKCKFVTNALIPVFHPLQQSRLMMMMMTIRLIIDSYEFWVKPQLLCSIIRSVWEQFDQIWHKQSIPPLSSTCYTKSSSELRSLWYQLCNCSCWESFMIFIMFVVIVLIWCIRHRIYSVSSTSHRTKTSVDDMRTYRIRL